MEGAAWKAGQIAHSTVALRKFPSYTSAANILKARKNRSILKRLSKHNLRAHTLSLFLGLICRMIRGIFLHGFRAIDKIPIRENIMIVSFGDPATADLFHYRQTSRVRRFLQDILKAVLRKLDVLNSAHRLQDLRQSPGNRLEALKGDLKGFHSIRVNDQWRTIFRWSANAAHQVSLADYH